MITDAWHCYQLVLSLYRLFNNESSQNIANAKYAATQCGPIGIKLMQFIVMHDGILSAECKKHFRNIFEDCNSHNWAHTEKVYKATFNRSIEDDFEISFTSKIPIGSGSIGQVYRIWSKQHKHFVALKVKHPLIAATVNRFTTNISFILNFVSLFYRIPFSIIIKEFLHNIRLQLDYTEEATNMERLRSYFSSEDHIVIPEVLHASADIIIMTYHDGVAFPELKDNKSRARVACDVFLFMATSLVCFDFVHCDMHYGNWKIDPTTEKLIIYDCGIVGQTGNHDTNVQVLKSSFDADYMNLAHVVTPSFRTHSHGQIMEKYIIQLMNTPYEKTSDRFADFLKKAFELNIPIDRDALRCVQGLIICVTTILASTDKLLKIIGPNDKSRRGHSEVFICYLIELLERTGKYASLKKELKTWIASDPDIEIHFYDWMENTLGHRDKDVFVDVFKRMHYPDKILTK